MNMRSRPAKRRLAILVAGSVILFAAYAWRALVRNGAESAPERPLPEGSAEDPFLLLPGPVPTEEIGIARAEGQGQVIELDFDDFGFRPAVLVLERGLDATIRFEFSPDLDHRDSVVEFPGKNAKLDPGSKERELFFAEPLGDFTFRTLAGRAHGYVRVVDDPRSVDLDGLRKLVSGYHPADGGLAPCCGY